MSLNSNANIAPGLRRVTLVIASLDAGGAERVLVGIANWLAVKGWEVTVVTMGRGESFYPLDARVSVWPLSLSRDSRSILKTLWYAFKRLIYLRRALKQSNPDAAICFIEKINLYFLIASVGLRFKKIVSERSDPRLYRNSTWWVLMRRFIYLLADEIIVQSESVKNWFQALGFPGVNVIPNALDAQRLEMMRSAQALTREANVSGHIVCVGRLHLDKGHARLIEACSSVFNQFPDWRLDIVGTGDQEPELREQVKEAGLVEFVTFHGLQADPFPFMKRAAVVVLASHVEGFPNVFIEGMALGKACVTFDSIPPGLLEDEKNGLVVSDGDIQGLSSAIIRVITDAKLRSRLAAHALDVRQKYDEDKVMRQWLDVL